MNILEKILFISLFGILGLLSIWLQFGLIQQEQVVFDGNERHDPDYYIENFTAIGMDEEGNRRYVLEAERLVHYPDDDTALLDNPHVIQYEVIGSPRHIYSESGWVSSNGNEVLLTGNVRVMQGTGGENIATDKLKVYLDRKKKSE